MIVVVPALGKFGLGKAGRLILVVGNLLGGPQPGVQVFEAPGGRAGIKLGLCGCQLVGELHIVGVLVETRLLGGSVFHELVVGEAIELDLVLLPRTARDVVVPDGPYSAHQEHRD